MYEKLGILKGILKMKVNDEIFGISTFEKMAKDVMSGIWSLADFCSPS